MLVRRTLLTLSALAMTSPALAVADDNTAPATSFVAETTTDGLIKLSAKAFEKGEFDRAIALSNQALRSGLSKKRKAVAQNNICAAEGALGNYTAASEACDTALELRPGYEPAEQNQSALTIMLAENK